MYYFGQIIFVISSFILSPQFRFRLLLF